MDGEIEILSLLNQFSLEQDMLLCLLAALSLGVANSKQK